MKLNWKKIVVVACKFIATILGAGAGAYSAINI